MGTINSEILEFMKNDVEDALYNFGHYTFSDKGAWEVCEMALDQLRNIPVEDAVATLQAFYQISDEAKQYVQEHICDLDDWDELYDENAPWHKFVMDNY